MIADSSIDIHTSPLDRWVWYTVQHRFQSSTIGGIGQKENDAVESEASEKQDICVSSSVQSYSGFLKSRASHVQARLRRKIFIC